VFAVGIAFGLTPLIANADGEGNISKISRLWKNGLVVNLTFGFVMMSLLFMAGPLFNHLKQEPEVVEFALPYFFIIITGIIPMMLFLNLKQFAEGLSDTAVATRVSLVANFINVALNYMLIKGLWVFPELGLLGAGYATVASRWLMFLGLWGYIKNKEKFKKYWIARKEERYKWSSMKDILNIGLPSGLQYIFEVGAFAISAVMAGSIGAFPQAAHQIAISLASISYMAASGLSAAASIRVGNQLGQKDYPQLKLAATTLFKMVLVFMTVTGIVFLLTRNILPTFFTDEPEVIAIAAQLLVITTFFQLSDGAQVLAQGALRGLSDVKTPTLITFVAYWVLALPSAYIFAFVFNWGIVGIWIGLAAGLTFSGALLTKRFYKKANELLSLQKNNNE
jgi:MATE family multidrug resistance protein